METGTRTSDDVLELLTAREREVMQRIARGMTNAQVAAELLVTTHAVKFHLAAIYRKLGVANRTEAATRYLTLSGGSALTSRKGA
jgi:DNA-binding NarL/FixJ family response regulator